jgi:hypothetical protein
MDKKTELKVLLYFTILYLAVFSVIALIKANYEFFYYIVLMSILIFFIVKFHKKFHLPIPVMTGLTIVGAMHIFGGQLHFNNIRLYDIWIIPSIFKYDNLIHLIAIFISTLVIYSLLYPHLDKKLEHNRWSLSLILILIAMGLGAFNKVIELGAVIFLGASGQVGDYLNNAIDLMYNLGGAVLACFYLMKHKLNKK